jgi:hypothetical protein
MMTQHRFVKQKVLAVRAYFNGDDLTFGGGTMELLVIVACVSRVDIRD